MKAAILADPGAAPLIQRTVGIRKFRQDYSGHGKRCGIRTINPREAGSELIHMSAVYVEVDCISILTNIVDLEAQLSRSPTDPKFRGSHCLPTSRRIVSLRR